MSDKFQVGDACVLKYVSYRTDHKSVYRPATVIKRGRKYLTVKNESVGDYAFDFTVTPPRYRGETYGNYPYLLTEEEAAKAQAEELALDNLNTLVLKVKAAILSTEKLTEINDNLARLLKDV